jgi:uncharacterized Zn finger protein
MKCEGCGQERDETGLVSNDADHYLVRCLSCIQKAVDECANRGDGVVRF